MIKRLWHSIWNRIEKGIFPRFDYEKDGYVPAIVVIGDLENEGAIEKQINWNTLPSNVQNVKNTLQIFL